MTFPAEAVTYISEAVEAANCSRFAYSIALMPHGFHIAAQATLDRQGKGGLITRQLTVSWADLQEAAEGENLLTAAVEAIERQLAERLG